MRSTGESPASRHKEGLGAGRSRSPAHLRGSFGPFSAKTPGCRDADAARRNWSGKRPDGAESRYIVRRDGQLRTIRPWRGCAASYRPSPITSPGRHALRGRIPRARPDNAMSSTPIPWPVSRSIPRNRLRWPERRLQFGRLAVGIVLSGEHQHFGARKVRFRRAFERRPSRASARVPDNARVEMQHRGEQGWRRSSSDEHGLPGRGRSSRARPRRRRQTLPLPSECPAGSNFVIEKRRTAREASSVLRAAHARRVAAIELTPKGSISISLPPLPCSSTKDDRSPFSDGGTDG